MDTENRKRSWDEMLQDARREQIPEVDLRRGVRERLVRGQQDPLEAIVHVFGGMRGRWLVGMGTAAMLVLIAIALLSGPPPLDHDADVAFTEYLQTGEALSLW